MSANGLRGLHLQRGLSQAQLARRARVHPSDVSRYETGRAIPYPGQTRRLARALGVESAELLALLRPLRGERVRREGPGP